MEIWIIRDGEKHGPLHDFEIRRQIEAGQLPPTTPAWHEGQPAWMPLQEIPLFTQEFERLTPDPVPEESPLSSPPPLPAKPAFFRRFCARWFDLSVFEALWWFGMWVTAQNIGATLVNPWILFFRYVPWFVFETVLLHHWGTTPGKWLLGLSVANLDGSRLDLGAATRRSARVLFSGIGFGWNLLAIFCQVLSWFTAKRLGTALWDHVGGHKVTISAFLPSRVTFFVIALIGALQLQVLVISPYTMKLLGEQRPEWKEFFEKYPFPHLPLRGPAP